MNVLVNYATPNFAARRYLNSVSGLRVGGFDKVVEYSPADLDPAFRRRNAHILRHDRGGGYWVWKPWIIEKTLKRLRKDDFMFYVDAGSFFVASIEPLVELMRRTDQDVIAFTCKWQVERMWTKRDAFVLMNCDSARFTDTWQVESGYSLWRRSRFSLALAAEWSSLVQDESLVTDAPSRCGTEEYPEFREHRHDQSVWSLLCKKHGVALHRQPFCPPDDAFPESAYPRLIAHRLPGYHPWSLLRFCLTHPAHIRLHGPILKTVARDAQLPTRTPTQKTCRPSWSAASSR